jgi:hypothetical protein
MTRIRLGILVGLVSLALAGCGVEGETISRDYALEGKGESVVIGRGEVYYSESGEIDVAFLSLRNESTEETYRVRYDTSHSDPLYFYVALKPAPYRVIGWDNMNWRGSANGRFDVKPGQIVYIGNLRFTARSRGKVRFPNPPGSLSVIDDYEQAVTSFRTYYPHFKQEVVKSLIRLGEASTVRGR